MPLLRVSLQYPREACTLESRGPEVAGAPPIAEGMAEPADATQMDRVHASGAWGREFESHRARHNSQTKQAEVSMGR